jgi:hypothetical protein
MVTLVATEEEEKMKEMHLLPTHPAHKNELMALPMLGSVIWSSDTFYCRGAFKSILLCGQGTFKYHHPKCAHLTKTAVKSKKTGLLKQKINCVFKKECRFGLSMQHCNTLVFSYPPPNV